MTLLNKLTSVIFLLLLCFSSQNLFSQNNISKTKSTDVTWERIPLPDGKEIRSFKVMPENKLYIGCKNGGVYQLIQDQWELVGLPTKTIDKIEEYLNGELLVSSDSTYVWDYNNWNNIQKPFYGTITKTFDLFFGGGSFEDLYHSSDGCYNWDNVHDISGCESVCSVVATSPDSIFFGYKNYCNGEGGVYLSTDGGINFNPFGLLSLAISSMAVDNDNRVYAGSLGNWDTGLCGLYRYNNQTELWDTLLIIASINTIEFNSENHIFLGYDYDGASDQGGVLQSEDDGESWIMDTAGIGSTWVHDLQIAENGILYALTGYTTKKLYRTVLPVEINENTESFYYKTNCYPNPVSNNLIISPLKKCNDDKPTDLIIYNTAGLEILHQRISNQDFLNGFIELNVSDFERGEYIYTIKSKNYITSNKFIRQ